LQTLLIKVT